MQGTGTLSTSWHISATSPIEVAERLEGHLVTWFYNEAQLTTKEYSLLTAQDEQFHKQSDYNALLPLIQGRVHTLIIHLEEPRIPTSSPLRSVEIWIYLHDEGGPTTIAFKMAGGPLDALYDVRERTRTRFDAVLAQIFTDSNTTGLEEVRAQGSSWTSSASVRNSIFDQADQSLMTTGQGLPRVFLSYSHDSEEHKAWVSKLANRLNSLRVWVIFDQWDLLLGGDLARFMEQGISSSDRVLVICTEEYNRKANSGKGGTGYEKMIMTADLLTDQGSSLIVPLVRGRQSPETPIFLRTRLYIDFRVDADFDAQIDRLAQRILEPYSQRPPLGQVSSSDV